MTSSEVQQQLLLVNQHIEIQGNLIQALEKRGQSVREVEGMLQALSHRRQTLEQTARKMILEQGTA